MRDETTETGAQQLLREWDERLRLSDPHEPITPAMWERLRAKWPNGERLTWAWRLAKDIDTCAALIAGQPVDPARINQAALRDATRRSLVQLVAPIDLFHAA